MNYTVSPMTSAETDGNETRCYHQWQRWRRSTIRSTTTSDWVLEVEFCGYCGLRRQATIDIRY